jgi:hypothetical protein
MSNFDSCKLPQIQLKIFPFLFHFVSCRPPQIQLKHFLFMFYENMLHTYGYKKGMQEKGLTSICTTSHVCTAMMSKFQRHVKI